MIKIKKKFKVAIDSPAAAGAGTVAKRISKHYNLLYLDTGKIYRLIGYYKIRNNNKISYSYIRKKINSLKIKDLNKKILLSDKIGVEASIIARNSTVRKIVHKFQIDCAYRYPKKFNGSCLDGRDITYKIIPDADFKFFITANVKTRSKRRFNELKKIGKKTSLKTVLNSIKKRDKSDYNRRISPLKKTKDSILINTTNLTKSACFYKIKNIIDRKLKINGNI